MTAHPLHLDEEIAACLHRGLPLVALETVVFSHGLPRAVALDTFSRICEAVRGEGAVPAACWVGQGRVRVSNSVGELAQLLEREPRKTTVSTLPNSVAGHWWASTTAGATMAVAHAAGMSVVATGGIGGVHGGTRWDVSGDLASLATFPVVVVCSGPKIILDIPTTMELLETMGVTVVGFRTEEVPGFYVSSTGIPVAHRVDTVEEVVEVWRACRSLGCRGALLVLNPPPPAWAFDAAEVREALEDLPTPGAAGPMVTPVLLAALQHRLGERAITLNRTLLVENATLGGRIARALHSR